MNTNGDTGREPVMTSDNKCYHWLYWLLWFDCHLNCTALFVYPVLFQAQWMEICSKLQLSVQPLLWLGSRYAILWSQGEQNYNNAVTVLHLHLLLHLYVLWSSNWMSLCQNVNKYSTSFNLVITICKMYNGKHCISWMHGILNNYYFLWYLCCYQVKAANDWWSLY